MEGRPWEYSPPRWAESKVCVNACQPPPALEGNINTTGMPMNWVRGAAAADAGCGRAWKNSGFLDMSCSTEQLGCCCWWHRCQIYWMRVPLWSKPGREVEERSFILSLRMLISTPPPPQHYFYLQRQEVGHLNVSTTQQGKQLLGLIYNQPQTCLLKTNFFPFLCKALTAIFTSDKICQVLIPFYLYEAITTVDLK